MKKKLTVTIDERLLPRAKQVAKRRRISLSRLIENALHELSDSGRATFSARWRGRFKQAQREGARYRALAKKYL
jgi:post-segregation antitoxin (ccd killing protein)